MEKRERAAKSRRQTVPRPEPVVSSLMVEESPAQRQQREPVGTVAVVGASGHLGASVVRALLGSGKAVRAVDRAWRSTMDKLDIDRATADVTQPETLASALDDVDAVINLAAVISVSGSIGGLVESVNIDGATNVANACLERNLPLVHCSSVHAFNLAAVGSDGVLNETSPLVGDAGAAYDISKRAGANAVVDLVADGLDAVVVHPTGLMGPYDAEPSLAGRSLLAIAQGRLLLAGPGGFDFADTRDVADSVVAALQHGRAGHRYLLGGRWHSTAELNRLSALAAGVRPPVATIPLPVAAAMAPVAELMFKAVGVKPIFSRESVATLRHGPTVDCAKAERELGHTARPIEQTLSDTYDWFRAVGLLD